MTPGTLYVVATPIGNLEDITARALSVLRSVALIAAEDTRHSGRLLRHFNINTRVTSCHEHNELRKADGILAVLAEGRDVALITDAGTPCISDPGYRVVAAAREAGFNVAAIPGPSALLAALSISGLPADRFTFHGFFPRKAKEADVLLEEASRLGGLHVWFESPNRLGAALTRIAEQMPGARLAIARELTKIHEELFSGTPEEAVHHFGSDLIRGECVLMLHASARVEETMAPEDIRRHAEDIMTREGVSRRDAIRMTASTLGLPRNLVYNAVTADEEDPCNHPGTL